MSDRIEVSVISPMYNEEEGIYEAVTSMLSILSKLPQRWEYVVINDGSTDRSLEIVSEIAKTNNKLRVVTYPRNRGRGYALRQGFAAAKGEIIISTEADSSWGENIVFEFLKKFEEEPQWDMLVASPHRAPGGYKNVPFTRVLYSETGNILLRYAMGQSITMYTGMCRAYKRYVLDALELESDDKELHLEIAYKALELGFKIGEIPAVLSWKTKKRGTKRRSSFNLQRIVSSHLRFTFTAAPVLWIGTIALLSLLISVLFWISALCDKFFYSGDSIFSSVPILQFTVLLFIFGLQLLIFSFLAYQNKKTQIELYRIAGKLKKIERIIDTANQNRN